MGLLLTGLDGRNPLGYLAAIGLLRVLDDDARRRKVALPTLSFEPGTAIARITSDLTLDAIIECVVADAAAQGDNRALQFAYTKDGDEASPESRDAVRDLKPPPALAAKLLRASATAPDRVAGLAAAWFSELVQAKTNESTKPTAFHFMAGNQTFLAMVHKLRTGTTYDAVREALLGPWLNDSPLPSLRWDSSVTRLYAFRARAPGPDKQGTVPAANWLGVIALEAFPVVPCGEELATTGIEGGWKSSVFRWPLWSPDATFSVVRSLMRVDSRQWTVLNREALGITEVLGAKIVRDDYASFAPAHVELPARSRRGP